MHGCINACSNIVMYACPCMYTCLYMHVHIHTWIHTWVQGCMYRCAHAHLHKQNCMYTCIHVCMCAWGWTLCICIHLCKFECTYKWYMHVYICTHSCMEQACSCLHICMCADMQEYIMAWANILMNACPCMYTFPWVNVHMHTLIHAWIHECFYVSMQVQMQPCAYFPAWLHVQMHGYTYICMLVYASAYAVMFAPHRCCSAPYGKIIYIFMIDCMLHIWMSLDHGHVVCVNFQKWHMCYIISKINGECAQYYYGCSGPSCHPSQGLALSLEDLSYMWIHNFMSIYTCIIYVICVHTHMCLCACKIVIVYLHKQSDLHMWMHASCFCMHMCTWNCACSCMYMVVCVCVHAWLYIGTNIPKFMCLCACKPVHAHVCTDCMCKCMCAPI